MNKGLSGSQLTIVHEEECEEESRRATVVNDELLQFQDEFLDHFDLLALIVECDCMGVAGSKENLEHFEGVSIERIPGNLSLTV